MENIEFTLFASTYPNIRNVITDLEGDIALNRNGVSDYWKYSTSSLHEAAQAFQASDTYTNFRDSHSSTTYIYQLLENASVKRVSDEIIE